MVSRALSKIGLTNGTTKDGAVAVYAAFMSGHGVASLARVNEWLGIAVGAATLVLVLLRIAAVIKRWNK